jgi:hypothetical protein
MLGSLRNVVVMRMKTKYWMDEAVFISWFDK